ETLTSYKNVIFLEEGYASSGLSKWIIQIMVNSGHKLSNILTIGLPHKIISHGSVRDIDARYGLDIDAIVEKIAAFHNNK
ncbi:MAG: hypothetical protein LAT54_10260, partial [Cryomorphaceae bacterium]|nr:hypothetical protein [Cryomorphaceae bacterium]